MNIGLFRTSRQIGHIYSSSTSTESAIFSLKLCNAERAIVYYTVQRSNDDSIYSSPPTWRIANGDSATLRLRAGVYRGGSRNRPQGGRTELPGLQKFLRADRSCVQHERIGQSPAGRSANKVNASIIEGLYCSSKLVCAVILHIRGVR